MVFKAGFTVLMKLESNFFTKKEHVKAMDAILEQPRTTYQKGCVARWALLLQVSIDLFSTKNYIGTKNGLHDPKKLEILVDLKKVKLTMPYLVTMVAKLQSYHEKLVNLTNFLIDVPPM